MKLSFAAASLAALLLSWSARAAVVYDTITGQTETNRLLLLTMQNHAPMGDSFSLALSSTVTSVEVQLIDPNGTSSSHITDSGSVLVYLVSASGTLPSATGLALTNDTFVGSIADTSLLGGSAVNNITLNTDLSLAAGNYWIVLTSGSDPNNYYQTINPTPTTAGWAEFQASTAVNAIGLQATNYSEYVNPTNTGLVNATNGYVYMAQVQTSTPEPASVLVLGTGLMAIGLRRRAKKSSDSAMDL